MKKMKSLRWAATGISGYGSAMRARQKKGFGVFLLYWHARRIADRWWSTKTKLEDAGGRRCFVRA